MTTRRSRSRRRPIIVPAVPQPGPALVAIAASTGGPLALQAIIRDLGAGFGLPILVAQHIAAGFVAGMVDWLNRTTPLTTRLAQHDEPLAPGHVYLAPDGQHLLAGPGGRVQLRAGAAGDRYCPSADVLFETTAAVYGRRAIGVMLTGMGNDGARGMGLLRAAGSLTLAQDEASCVVYGMPQAAIAAGAVRQIEPLGQIGAAIRRALAMRS